MAKRLRSALRHTLRGWQEDVEPAWRDVVRSVALAYGDVDPTLEIEPWEPIFPARRGAVFPGAPAGAHMLRAFDGIAPEDVRCVILGQDPYPCPAFATGRAFEAGNVAHWRELDKMFSPSVRAFIQAIIAARTGEARYARRFADWPATLAAIESGAVDLEAPEALADRWVASGVLLLNSSLTLSRFQRAVDPHQRRGHLPLWRPLMVRVVEHLAGNFFRDRFDRLTPLEQKYLRAMAELGPGPHTTGSISDTLGVRTASVATVRQRLIAKGMVWSQRHGETAFTVPMFDAFMKRQMPTLIKHVPQHRGR